MHFVFCNLFPGFIMKKKQLNQYYSFYNICVGLPEGRGGAYVKIYLKNEIFYFTTAGKNKNKYLDIIGIKKY